MKNKFKLVFLLILQITYSHTELEKQKYGITYGSNAPINSYPCYCRIWILALTGDTFFCGGVLIASNKILTAAHCFRKVKNVYACCGSASCQSDEGSCYYGENAEGVFVHKGYIQATLEGQLYDDIAFINTTGNFLSPTASVCPICSTKTGTGISLEGLSGNVIGCGITQNGKVSNLLSFI